MRSRTGPWLIDLKYRHITATLVFNEEYSTENTRGKGGPGGLLEGSGWWCVPGGTAVEIASWRRELDTVFSSAAGLVTAEELAKLARETRVRNDAPAAATA